MNKKKIVSLVLAGALFTGSIFSYNFMRASASDDTGIDTIPGTVRTESELNGSFLSVTGFADGKVTDRSQYQEGDSEYAVVLNEYDLLEALDQAKYGLVKVIEVRADLNLGWNELSDDVKNDFDGYIEPYTGSEALSATPVANPSLIESGVSCLTINNVDGLTIFSKTGNTIKHAEFKFNADVNDVVVRNLSFQEMWEWDDWRPNGFGSTGGKGTHKRTGWTNIKINGAKNM